AVTSNGWLQIALFGVIVIAITRPFGGYTTRVFAGERTFLSPVLRPVEHFTYWCCGVDETEEQSWRVYAVSRLFFGVPGFATLYALQPAMVSAVQPAGAGWGRAGAGVQHLGKLRHQHELAVLRAGDHDGLPCSDGGAHGPQFRFGCRWHSIGDC